MERLIYYTDKIMGDGYALFLDYYSNKEYFLDSNNILWNSDQAGEILLDSLGFIGENDFNCVMVKRKIVDM